ncbi:hypothetical protein DL93DRAFT_2076640 [Clavulina sp. PMI_390]|nr:hypothetical protein DL93DRAFT_2076640 [Clavulina sp. PMI_390]
MALARTRSRCQAQGHTTHGVLLSLPPIPALVHLPLTMILDALPHPPGHLQAEALQTHPAQAVAHVLAEATRLASTWG